MQSYLFCHMKYSVVIVRENDMGTLEMTIL